MLKININLSNIFIAFLIIHFFEFILVVYVCETKYVNSINNEIIFNNSYCEQTYSSVTVKYLIDLFANSRSFVWILNNMVPIYLFVFAIIICYGIIVPTSGAGTTTTRVFQTLHQDLKDCTMEIWGAVKQGSNKIADSTTIVKLLELIVIGTLIIHVPDIVTYLLKSS